MIIKLFDLGLTEEEKKYFRPKFKNYFSLNDKIITVPEEIHKAFEIEKICLVHFRSDSEVNAAKKGYDGSRNIWAFNEQGEKLWEIEGAVESVVRQRIEKEGFPRERFYKDGVLRAGYDTYVALGQGKSGTEYEGRVGAGTFGGFSGEVDIKTGKVSHWIQGK